MWADAAERGRRTNWKYVFLLLFSAGAMLLSRYLFLHPQKLMFLGRAPALQSVWKEAPCGADTQTVPIGGKLYLSGDGRGYVLDCTANTVFPQYVEAGSVLCQGGFPVSYVPMGKEIKLWNTESSLSLPDAVDGVFVGEDHMAVITAGSGYLTQTILYDDRGNEQGRIGLTDEAMVFGAFLSEDSLFAALSFSEARCWYLTMYRNTGAQLFRVDIAEEMCCGLTVVEDRLVVRTDRCLLLFSKEGTLLRQISYAAGDFVFWDTRGGLLALITESRQNYYLKTFDCNGDILGEVTLPGMPRGMKISGNHVFVLDYEALRGYDAFCRPFGESEEGMRAVGLAADDEHVWLLGNGERMEFKTS